MTDASHRYPPSDSTLDDVVQSSPERPVLLAILDAIEENNKILTEIRDELKAQGEAL